MLSIFIEIEVCKNERISGSLKILNTMSHKKRLKKDVFFHRKILKKSFKEIYFCDEHLEKNDQCKF